MWASVRVRCLFRYNGSVPILPRSHCDVDAGRKSANRLVLWSLRGRICTARWKAEFSRTQSTATERAKYVICDAFEFRRLDQMDTQAGEVLDSVWGAILT